MIAHDSILAYRTEIFSTCMLPKFNLPIMELYSYLIYLFKANSDLLESKLHVYLFHPIKYVTHHLQMRSHTLFRYAFHYSLFINPLFVFI